MYMYILYNYASEPITISSSKINYSGKSKNIYITLLLLCIFTHTVVTLNIITIITTFSYS